MSPGLRTGLLAVLAAAAGLIGQPAAAATVYVAGIDGPISVATAQHVEAAVERAEDEGADALVLELDTPGGVLDATKDIVSSLLNARVPVIVYVSPRGAWAASAGTFITMAAHVAAMSPGTSIGAAHPVFQGQGPTLPPPERDGEGEDPERRRDYMNEKIENFTAAFIESIATERGRNVKWAAEAVRDSVAIGPDAAVEMNVVDLVAANLDDLLEQIHGREVVVDGEKRVLDTADARRVEVEMTGRQRFLAFLANPQVSALLMLGALAGLYMEVQSPGLIIPGALGASCLVLFLFSLQIIPFDWIGVLLMLVGLGLLVAEIFVTSFGLLFAAGLACFAIGAYMSFRVPEVSDLALPVTGFILPVTAVLAVFGAIVVFGVSRSFARPQYTGAEGLIGERGVAADDVSATSGRVRVRGELWAARSEEPIPAGDRIEVTELNNLVVSVRRAGDPGGSD